MIEPRDIPNRRQSAVWADDDVIRYAVKISVWGRWLVLLAAVFQLVYRPSFWYPDDIEYLYVYVATVAYNGAVHWRLATRGTVSWRWMGAASASDLVLVTAAVVIGGGFKTFAFLAYYPGLVGFALVFSALWLSVGWATVAAAAYSVASWGVGPGLDLDAGEEKVLLARVCVMYAVVVVVSMIVRFERIERQSAVTRERRLQQERGELSQAIHDTTAQTAYMIGLGIDGAMRLAGESDPKLAERLAATSALAKSAMWELRKPIDSGLIFEGRELGHVLRSHTATFANITAVAAEMAQTGEEPPLTEETRIRLFSIAHNALANAFVHAHATKVGVMLDFGPEQLRLTVVDDGIGLPEDYRERGRGFAGMSADAARLGGELNVRSSDPQRGTSVTCVVPVSHGQQ